MVEFTKKIVPHEFAKSWYKNVASKVNPNCFRDPKRNESEIPVSLQDPIFAYFMENYDKHEIIWEDEIAARELVDKMCIHYPNETKQVGVLMEVAKKLLPGFNFYQEQKFEKKNLIF